MNGTTLLLMLLVVALTWAHVRQTRIRKHDRDREISRTMRRNVNRYRMGS